MSHEFDSYAEDYQDIMDTVLKLTGETSEYYAHYKTRKLTEWLPEYLNKPSKILDFGCGVGLMTGNIATLFPQATIYGIDSSKKSIDMATNRYKNINFSVSEAILPFPEQFFDLIIVSNVFHHIPYQEHAAYIAETFRVLRNQGTFVMIEVNPLNPGAYYIFNKCPTEKNARVLTPWYTSRLVKSYGAAHTNYFCFYPKILHMLRGTEPYITKIPFGGMYACVVRKS